MSTIKTMKAGVVGAAGFAGVELVRILLTHPQFSLEVITSDSLAGKPLGEVYPAFRGVSDLAFSTMADAPLTSCDVVFLAVPHTASLAITPGLLAAGVSVVDLSADFRLKDPATYEQWYNTPHTATDELAHAAFGLPELTSAELALAAERHAQGEAVLVACAGCYPTATSLAAAPAIKAGFADEAAVIVADAISGVTGAGKKASERTHFCFANENLDAYGVFSHRHTPEIEQILGIPERLVFTPHLAPLNRGLLSTVTVPCAADKDIPETPELVELYREFYAECPLIEVLPANTFPRTDSVVGTDRAHIGVAYNRRTRTIVAIGAIDNLGKGAAGQAVQCANIICGLPQQTGLTFTALPI